MFRGYVMLVLGRESKKKQNPYLIGYTLIWLILIG